MATKFIPAGRTSMVKTGGLSLQVQTEYATNPSPRVTTTILQEGQVLHKVQRNLEKPISSIEEQSKMEMTIVRQHADILSILRDGKATRALKLKLAEKDEEKNNGSVETLREIPGVRNVYRLDNDGNFVGARTSEQFQESFGPIFQNMHQLLSIFLPDPEKDGKREKGVHEIEEDRLYLVSVGDECYFVVIEPKAGVSDYGDKIRQVVMAGV